MDRKIPEIRARFAPGNRYNYWITEPCCWCGRKHQHGAAAPGNPLLLMSRQSHCVGGAAYELVADMTDADTAEAVKRFGLLAPRGYERDGSIIRAL